MGQLDIQATASARRRWRYIKDVLTTWSITAGGISVLLAILLIFFYLLYEILPLFQGASVDKLARFQLPESEHNLILAIEEQNTLGFRLSNSGLAEFFSLSSGDVVKKRELVSPQTPITSFALDSEQSGIFALGLEGGKVVVAKHDYRPAYQDEQRRIEPRIDYPFGETALTIAPGKIDQLAIRDTADALVIVALSHGQLLGRRWRKQEDFLSDEIRLTEEPVTLPVLDMPVGRLYIGPGQHWLYALSDAGEYRLVDLRTQKIADRGRLFQHAALVDAKLLLGGISLLAASDEGELGQWFVSRDTRSPSGYRLQHVRSFSTTAAPISALVTEHRRKGFAVVDQNGVLELFHSTANRRLLGEDLTLGPVAGMAISPRADRLLIETAQGDYRVYAVDNKHPEISWSALWQKVWYESYPEADYVWQSSAANSDFEPKYSFVPLAFGTVKAAFYAMLIAAPLAVCGAIYTAFFMAPSLRRRTKPLVELMEALPTVILGFLAGLWLAPFAELHLPAIFSLLILLPVAVLVFAWLWEKMPAGFQQSLPEGHHPLWLLPVIIVLGYGCIQMSAPLERLLFDGDMRTWMSNVLGIGYDQRNAMIVGLAMGFAVVPTIYSIAEDAIFSVPRHLSEGSLALGATPWQSLVGVVLPTASPGIFSALMIGLGRAVGETMIVLMATGNTPIMDANIFEGMRTLSANIAVEIGETEVNSSHYRVLFLAAFVLFIFTFLVNSVAESVRQRLRTRYGDL
jgi:phosphate transport system permease protein